MLIIVATRIQFELGRIKVPGFFFLVLRSVRCFCCYVVAGVVVVVVAASRV